MKQSSPRNPSTPPQFQTTSPRQNQPLMRYSTTSRRSSAVNYSKGTTTQELYLQSPPLKPQVFNRSTNKPPPPPQFEKEFGPFSNVVNNNKDGDISGMFKREGGGGGQRMSGGFRVDDELVVGSPGSPGWGATTTVSNDSALPSIGTPVVVVSGGGGSGRRRSEDLDRILAKYGKDLHDQAETMLPRTETYKVMQPGIHSGYWDNHINQVEVQQNVGGRRNKKSMDTLNGNVEINNPHHHQQQQQPPQQLKRSTHVFPFKETQGGLLVVDPCQIAFESRKLSVLVADPNNNNNNVHSECRHERILHEVRKAMSMSVENVEEKKSMHGKEVVVRKYSDSKKATPEFQAGLLQKLVTGKNADTHVVIGDKVFPCHGVALEVMCGYFDKLAREREAVQRVQLNEQEVSAQAFSTIMNWLFQSEENRKSLVSKENLLQLYLASKHLGIRDLESQCIVFVDKKLHYSDPDLLSIWDGVKSRQSSCPELVKIIGAKLASSFKDIYTSKKYLTMDVDELHMLLTSDDLAIDSEMEVYDTAVTWLIHDFKSRKMHTNRMMSCIRFGLLSPLQLTQINLCPEVSKFKNEKDYNQVLTYGTVKSMIDDGLSYSILVESYKENPEELQRWVDKTGVKVPGGRRGLKGVETSSSQASGAAAAESIVHEISKPKLLTNSSGLLITIDK